METYQFNGHAGLSRLMDQGLVLILRRFTELNARNLLAMQAELQKLERELEVISKIRQDETASPEPKAGGDENSISDTIVLEEEILLEIRTKLQDYSMWNKTRRRG
jgi:hypothetical protein